MSDCQMRSNLFILHNFQIKQILQFKMRFLIVLAAIASIVVAETNIENPSECHKDLESYCDGTDFSINGRSFFRYR